MKLPKNLHFVIYGALGYAAVQMTADILKLLKRVNELGLTNLPDSSVAALALVGFIGGTAFFIYLMLEVGVTLASLLGKAINSINESEEN